MTQFKPFTFDRDFTETAYPKEKPTPEEIAAMEAIEEPVVPTFSEEELAHAQITAKEQGFQEGYAQGRDEALNGIEAQIRDFLPSIAIKFGELPEQIAITNAQKTADMLQLVRYMFEKLHPSLVAATGSDELLEIFDQAMYRLADEEKVVVRLTEDVIPYLQPKLEALASDQGFDGRLLIVPDLELQVGDIRVDWTGGFLQRNLAQTYKEADRLLLNTLAQLEDKFPGSVREMDRETLLSYVSPQTIAADEDEGSDDNPDAGEEGLEESDSKADMAKNASNEGLEAEDKDDFEPLIAHNDQTDQEPPHSLESDTQ